MKHISLHNYDDKKEELLNGITHIIGALLSIAGLVLLILRETKTPYIKGATIVYASSMLLLFSASSTYHLLSHPIAKRIGRIIDHCNIYFMIAGTYTPIAFLMGEKAGIFIISVEWALTALGILFTMIFWGKLKPLHVVFYLIMGWMIAFVWKDFKAAAHPNLLKWIIYGGIIYTLGTIVYGLKKIPYYHAVWHLFVVAGALFMYIGIYKYII